MEHSLRGKLAASLGKARPQAKAELKGSALAPELSGKVEFYPFEDGSIVVIEVTGLPEHEPAILDKQPIGPFGFHIHEGSRCGIAMGEHSFESAGEHYSKTPTYHPEHTGDLPVVFSNHGRALMVVYTDRFRPKEVINRTVMLHQNPDDFRSQPSGNSGVRIACGIIEKA